jgi:hypothetical protein
VKATGGAAATAAIDTGTFVCSFCDHMLKWQQANEISINAPIGGEL